MTQISSKKILITLTIIFLLSRTGKIREFISALHFGEILTLEPLRESPPQARFFVTIMFCALVFVTVFCLLNKRRRK